MIPLTKEELAIIRKKPLGRGTMVRATINNLQIGEGVIIEPKDWNQKRSPNLLITRLQRNSSKKFTCHRSMDAAGWVVERVK